MGDRNASFTVESRLTPDALRRLHQAGFSRRRFLQGSGALVVAFTAADIADRVGVAPGVVAAQGGNTPQTLDSWISIDASGHVTVYTGRADFGQGMSTV